MLHFINTRPPSRATHLLPPDWGAEYFIPLLQLDACPLNAELEKQLKQAVECDVIVVVSPTAVEIAMRHAQQLGIDFTQFPIHWVAVGQKTAECLANYSIMAECPSLETSEGMWQLPIFQQNIQRVAFWRGHGGREWLIQQLQQRHIDILNILLYQRDFPASSQHIWQSLCTQLTTQDVIVVLISSGESWRYWCKMQQYDLANYRVYYLVLGERVFNVVQQQKLVQHHAILLNSLNHEQILQHLQPLKIHL